MGRAVFLVEERSMAVFLKGLLPRAFPGLDFLCSEYEGKHDLTSSIPRMLRDWRTPGDCFVVVHDNDRKDCRKLKSGLRAQCKEGRREDTLIRIACQELEAWYWGDLPALAKAYEEPAVQKLAMKSQFRKPDEIPHPYREIKQRIREFKKISGARLMAEHMNPKNNRSPSFRIFMRGVAALVERMAEDQGK